MSAHSTIGRPGETETLHESCLNVSSNSIAGCQRAWGPPWTIRIVINLHVVELLTRELMCQEPTWSFHSVCSPWENIIKTEAALTLLNMSVCLVAALDS